MVPTARSAIVIFIIGLLHLRYCLSSESEDFKDYEKVGLENHNNRRKCHNAPPLRLSHAMNIIAEYCAHYHLQVNTHEGYRVCGQFGLPGEYVLYDNFHIMPTNNKDYSSLVKSACDFWYGLCPEIEAKDLVHHGSWDNYRHWDFAHMMWKRHEVLGIGVATDRNGTRAAVVSLYRRFDERPRPGETYIDVGGCCSGDSSSAKYRFCLNHILLGVAIFTNFLLAYFP